MSSDHLHLGQTGEAAAVAFLKKNRFTVLETNFKTRQAEIDIIARQDDTLCFIEVKTRKSNKKGWPREAVTPAKQKKIIHGALGYLQKKKLHDAKVRFDVIEVWVTQTDYQIHLIKHAFGAESFE
jgi:putative endonuclease